MREFKTLSQIDYGELERQMVNGINACVDDIHRDEDQLTEARQVSITVKLTPDNSGNLDITYDVTPKLAKRKGVVQAYVDRRGRLILGSREEQGNLPTEEPEGFGSESWPFREYEVVEETEGIPGESRLALPGGET